MSDHPSLAVCLDTFLQTDHTESDWLLMKLKKLLTDQQFDFIPQELFQNSLWLLSTVLKLQSDLQSNQDNQNETSFLCQYEQMSKVHSTLSKPAGRAEVYAIIQEWKDDFDDYKRQYQNEIQINQQPKPDVLKKQKTKKEKKKTKKEKKKNNLTSEQNALLNWLTGMIAQQLWKDFTPEQVTFL